MQKYFKSLVVLGSALLGLLTVGIMSASAVMTEPSGSVSDYFGNLIHVITGDWQQYGELFTFLQGNEYFMWGFILIITVIPVVFALHLLIVGAKHFDHGGNQILFFPLFARIIHFIGALSFAALTITGLLIICGQFFGGGGFIRLARYVHIFGAILSLPAVVFMLIIWFKDMLPALCDIKWIFILGGYLSKKKVPVPAKKFNAGQKMWFWCAIPGGLIMLATGYIIWAMGAGIELSFITTLDMVRVSTMVHMALGMIIVAFFLTHCYMSIFAIAGSLESMKTGYKPEEEVHILHSLHKYKDSDVVPGNHH